MDDAALACRKRTTAAPTHVSANRAFSEMLGDVEPPLWELPINMEPEAFIGEKTLLQGMTSGQLK